MLESYGAKIIDADKLGHEAYNVGTGRIKIGYPPYLISRLPQMKQLSSHSAIRNLCCANLIPKLPYLLHIYRCVWGGYRPRILQNGTLPLLLVDGKQKVARNIC